MDDITFDRIAVTVSAGWGRRSILGLLAGTAFGRLTSLSGLDEAEARDKKKGGNKKKGNGKKHDKKKKKRDKPKGEPCGDGYCNQTQCCHLGQCVDRSLCCTANSDCNLCSRCEIGLCVPNPDMNGKACNGCLECANGACGIPNAEFCEDDQQCRPNGECCPKCVNDTCCSAREACINPGPFNDNFCCDKVVNQPCGANEDGTFSECCNLRTEECVDGHCVLKPACEGDLTAQGLCCPNGQVACTGPSGPFCAPAGHKCCGDASCDSSQVCCDPSQGLCCARGSCGERQCCTGGMKSCQGTCVDTRTDRRHCGACDSWCDGPGLECCGGSCKTIQTDEENCGACGVACDARTQRCVDGQCREICSLNQPPWQNACDDGVDYWCCPDGSTRCCRLSGRPHCC